MVPLGHPSGGLSFTPALLLFLGAAEGGGAWRAVGLQPTCPDSANSVSGGPAWRPVTALPAGVLGPGICLHDHLSLQVWKMTCWSEGSGYIYPSELSPKRVRSERASPPPCLPPVFPHGDQLPWVREGQACGAVQKREPVELRVTEEEPPRLGRGGDGGGEKAGSPPGRGWEMVLSWVIVVTTALGH